MSYSKSIQDLTVSTAIRVINDIVVNAIIDLDFKVEDFTKSGFTLNIKGLKFRFLHIVSPDGTFNVWQFNYSDRVESLVFKLSYDESIILPILRDVLANGIRSAKAAELAELKERQSELELELA